MSELQGNIFFDKNPNINEILRKIDYSHRDDPLDVCIEKLDEFKNLREWSNQRYEIVRKKLNELKIEWKPNKLYGLNCLISLIYNGKKFFIEWYPDNIDSAGFVNIFNPNRSKSYSFKNLEEFNQNIINKLNEYV